MNLIFSLASIVLLVNGETMHTGNRAASVDDSAHSDALPWYPQQRDWHPSHVTDLKVMGMDRIRGSLVGYNSRTGKVMSQKPTEERPMRISYSEGILLESTECFALTRTDGQFSWRPPDGKRSQLWIARSNSGWASRITKFTMSNRNDGSYCECSVRAVNGPWRSTAMRMLDLGGCTSWDEPKELLPGHVVHIPDHHELSPDARRLECESLTQVLENTDWFFAHHDQITESDCTKTARNALSSVDHRPRVRSLTQLPRPPRARVMADLKHSARVMDSVDAPLAVLAVSLETVAHEFRKTLRGSLYSLHNNSRLLPDEREAYERSHSSGGYMDNKIIYRYNRSCDSAMDPLVYAALTSDAVSLTPETSNVTRLAMAYAVYAEEHMTCLQAQMRAMGRAVECAGGWFEAQAESMGASQSSEGDVDSALQEIRSGLHPNKLVQLQREGKDADDLGDEIVRLVVTGAEAMFRRTVALFSSYQSLVIAWRRYAGVEVQSGLIEDIWCCFVTTLVDDPRYPPCLLRSIRLVHREIKRELKAYDKSHSWKF